MVYRAGDLSMINPIVAMITSVSMHMVTSVSMVTSVAMVASFAMDTSVGMITIPVAMIADNVQQIVTHLSWCSEIPSFH